MSEKRIGDWIQTWSGRKMFPLDPRPDEILIEDIAHALSMQCRFAGHCKRFYSVAQHSCHVHDLLPLPLRKTGLLHDASEAYLCDMPRPIKRSLGFAQQYLMAEAELQRVILEKFECGAIDDVIHDADNQMLATEAVQLMSPLHPDWADRYRIVDGLKIPKWNPMQAREEFLWRFYACAYI